jgi:hypothetical protein
MLKLLRDWWKGYDADDLRSLRAKLRGVPEPGGTIELTRREFKAYLAVMRDTDCCNKGVDQKAHP